MFTDLDTEESMRVVVINKAMTKYWDGADPIGQQDRAAGAARRERTAPRPEWFTVVGVVGDVRQFGLAQDTVAQVYLPLTQTPFGIAGQILVRTAGDPAAFGNVLRSTVHAVDPNQPVENVQTLDDLRSEALAAPRLTATLLGVFAALALLVTLAGIGGVIATSVQQRTKEFGLRMALGARRDSVLMMVVRQGLTLVADRTGDRRGRCARGRPRAVVVSLPDGAARSAHLRGRRAGVHAGGHHRVPDSGAARDDRRSVDCAARRVEN